MFYPTGGDPFFPNFSTLGGSHLKGTNLGGEHRESSAIWKPFKPPLGGFKEGLGYLTMKGFLGNLG